MYLQSVYAASSEEIEIFLSPVASRSRVREAVRGLSATRQIHSLSMDAQTYHFLEGGLPEFAELPPPEVTVALPGAIGSTANGVETQKRSMPAPRPLPRKVQATKPADSPIVPAAAPIFRRTKPQVKPEMPDLRPAASLPAARSEWKKPGRAQLRPGSSPWRPPAKPPARAARWTGKEGGVPPGGAARPASGPRPAFAPARTFSAPDGGRGKTIGDRPERGAPRSETGPYTKPYDRPRGAQPDARRGARPAPRPGTPRTGPAKREPAKPWALPARPSGSTPRPPRPGARRDASFRPAQKHRDRPSAGVGGARVDADRPRAPRGERGPGDPGRARFSRPPGGPQARPGRPQGPPHGANRPAGPTAGRSSSRPPAGFRPKPGPRSGSERPSRPPSGNRRVRSKATGRPSSPPPGARAAGAPPRHSADATPRTPGRIAGARPNRSPGYDRPRPGGYAKSGAKPRPGGATGRDSGDRARPPFVPRSGPAKSGSAPFRPRAGSTPGKPGKPSFRARKPDRNQPGQ
jgi:hypothetical protein